MDEKLTKVRSEEVRVKFLPDMKKRVDRIAAMHGTPAATWCHHVIAQAVVACRDAWSAVGAGCGLRTRSCPRSLASGSLAAVIPRGSH